MAQIKDTSSIRSNRLFAGVPEFRYNFKEKNYLEVKEGEVIFSKGEKSEYIFLVLSGRVKFKIYENPRQQKVFIVSKNEFFGEKELIDKTPRNSSAVAEKTSSLFRITYKDLMKLTGEHRKILSNLSELKYEEIISPSRNAGLKKDIFSRLIEDSDSNKRGSTIEIKDYSSDNPLLEMKAKDEITEELKIYQDENGTDENSADKDQLIDEEGVTWDLDEEENAGKNIDGQETTEQDEGGITEQTKEEENEPAEDIIENFRKIRDQVNSLSESLDETEPSHEDEKQSVSAIEPVIIRQRILDESYIAAVEKLSSAFDEEETLRFTIEACTELVNAEHGILYFPDQQKFLKGRLLENDKEITAGPETIPARCFRDKNLINIKDIYNDLNFNPSVDHVGSFNIHNLICVPIQDGGKVRAVLQLFNNRQGGFSDTDENMLKSISPVINQTLSRTERYTVEKRDAEVKLKELEKPVEKIAEAPKTAGKQVQLKVISDFLLQEIQVVVGDIKQFNVYLQKIDIPGEAKEISDIVTNQTSKIIDLLESLKIYSDKRVVLPEENESYITVFTDMMGLLAEYTESRKVNLYKKFETDAQIYVNSKFLYLAIFQIIKYQCDLMPFGGNIFISSTVSGKDVEITIRNATRKTDENLVINAGFQFNEDTAPGFGLSLAKRIIEDHGADLQIKTQSGTGLEIGVRFPPAK